jgi:hypothetical protein
MVGLAVPHKVREGDVEVPEGNAAIRRQRCAKPGPELAVTVASARL